MGDFVEFAPPLVEVPHVAIVVVLDVADMPALLAVFQKSTCTSTSTSTSVGSHCCMVSLDMVAGAFHLRCAVDSALQRRSSGMGKTGNFGDEVAYRLAVSTNIKRVVEQNRASADDTSVAAVFVGDTDETLQAAFALAAAPLGRVVPAEAIASSVSDAARARMSKEYKLTDLEVKIFTLEDCVVNKIATKDL